MIDILCRRAIHHCILQQKEVLIQSLHCLQNVELILVQQIRYMLVWRHTHLLWEVQMKAYTNHAHVHVYNYNMQFCFLFQYDCTPLSLAIADCSASIIEMLIHEESINRANKVYKYCNIMPVTHMWKTLIHKFAHYQFCYLIIYMHARMDIQHYIQQLVGVILILSNY